MAEKRVVYALQGWGARLLFALFGWLPIERASATGGFLARAIGPHLGASKRAVINLRRAMPALSEAEIAAIVRGMWDNLGRVVAEYPHLREIDIFAPGGRVETVGFDAILGEHAPRRPLIFFSAHYGNWEIASLAAQDGFNAVQVYRAANNPIVEDLIRSARGERGGELIRKGASGARRALAALRSGRNLGMLVDQKMNDGIAVKFFGRDAMTTPALALFARRFDCVVVPARVERLAGARFRLTCEAPLPVPKTDDARADVLALMTTVNETVERWVRARPDHWFWLHRRWPD